ncbi:Ovate protein family, C-terminal [Sesbania bispinosa]|nr:Ovate protein family, C-terminal [Sesbania bispinosa]
MGNNRFRLSDMIPNAWFYKLKDMSRSRKRNGPHVMKSKATSPTTSQRSLPRYSHYFSTEPIRAAPDCSCRVSSSTNDIIIDMNNESFPGNSEKLDGFDTISQLGLAPILTKPVKFDDKVIEAKESRSSTSTELDDDDFQIDQSFSIKISKEESSRTQRRRKSSHIARKSSPNSTGIRLRINSPKLASRKIQACARRSVSSSANKASKNAGFPDGFAVVKSSFDPQSDFRESMVEMIVENNIRASKDLEDLLACYLSLNSSEYHDIIVKAFEQIWYDMAQLRM